MRPFRVLTCAVLMVSVSGALSGCMVPSGGGGAPAAQAQPGLAAQGTILALQTFLMLQQSKATAAAAAARSSQEADKQRARAASAGSIMSSLGYLRTESNCAKRLQLATAVSGGLQAEFPNYQSELSLGTNLVSILAAGFPGCQ